MRDAPMVSYRHEDGGPQRFRQFATDTLPKWAVDVEPCLNDVEIARAAAVEDVLNKISAATESLTKIDELNFRQLAQLALRTGGLLKAVEDQRAKGDPKTPVAAIKARPERQVAMGCYVSSNRHTVLWTGPDLILEGNPELAFYYRGGGGTRGARARMYAFLARYPDGKGLKRRTTQHRFYVRCLERARILSDRDIIT